MDKARLGYRQSTAAVVVNNQGKILLVQKIGWRDNEWSFPGGGTEEGETPEQTIIRELREELGTDKFAVKTKSNQIDQYEWPDKLIERKLKELDHTWRGQRVTLFLVGFLGEETDINFQKEEIQKIMWADPSTLARYFVFPNQLAKAERLLEEFKLNFFSQ